MGSVVVPLRGAIDSNFVLMIRMCNEIIMIFACVVGESFGSPFVLSPKPRNLMIVSVQNWAILFV